MSKLSDQIQAALDRKRGFKPADTDVVSSSDKKVISTRTQPPQGKKPPTRNAGRGR